MWSMMRSTPTLKSTASATVVSTDFSIAPSKAEGTTPPRWLIQPDRSAVRIRPTLSEARRPCCGKRTIPGVERVLGAGERGLEVLEIAELADGIDVAVAAADGRALRLHQPEPRGGAILRQGREQGQQLALLGGAVRAAVPGRQGRLPGTAVEGLVQVDVHAAEGRQQALALGVEGRRARGNGRLRAEDPGDLAVGDAQGLQRDAGVGDRRRVEPRAFVPRRSRFRDARWSGGRRRQPRDVGDGGGDQVDVDHRSGALRARAPRAKPPTSTLPMKPCRDTPDCERHMYLFSPRVRGRERGIRRYRARWRRRFGGAVRAASGARRRPAPGPCRAFRAGAAHPP